MKKIIIAALLILLATASSAGQWYYKRYYVHDINMLTEAQLKEAIDKTGSDLAISLGTGVLGGILMFAGNYTLRHGLSEDANFVEQLLGDEIVGKACIVLGIGCVAGGAAASVISFGRFEKLRALKRTNYPQGSIGIAPALILSEEKKPLPGISLSLNF